MSARPLARPHEPEHPPAAPATDSLQVRVADCLAVPVEVHRARGKVESHPRELLAQPLTTIRQVALGAPRARAAGPPWRRGRPARSVSPRPRAAARETPSRTLSGDAHRRCSSAGGIDDAPTTPAGGRAMGTRVFESSSTYVPTTIRVSGDPTVRASAGRKSDPVKTPPEKRGDAVGAPESVGDLRVAEVDRRGEARCHVPPRAQNSATKAASSCHPTNGSATTAARRHPSSRYA